MNYINVVICPSIISGFWNYGSSSLVESFQDPGFTMKAQGAFDPHLWCWRRGIIPKINQKTPKALWDENLFELFLSFFFLKSLIDNSIALFFSCSSKIFRLGGGRNSILISLVWEMVEWLRELAVLSKDLSLTPSIHVREPITTFNSRFRALGALFWPPQAPAHKLLMHRLTHINKN